MSDSCPPQRRLILNFRNVLLGGLIANVFFLWFQPDHYPKNTFLCIPEERFSDFTRWIFYRSFLIKAEWACPPFCLLLATFWKEVAALTGLIISFCLYSFSCLALHSVIVFHELSRWGKKLDFLTWVTLSFLSYPVLFTLNRGNAAWMVYLSIYGFFYFCRRDKYQWAAFFLAIAISIKIVPVLLLFYLFYKGRWLPALFSLLETAFLDFIGFFVFSHFFYPGYSVDLFLSGLKSYREIYAIQGLGLAFSCSFYSFIMVLVHFYTYTLNPFPVPYSWASFVLNCCNFFTVIVMISICVWTWRRRRKISEFKVASLLILFLLLVPPVTADYYLLFCYLLLFDLLHFDLASIPFKIYSICLGLLMIPKAYCVFFRDVNLGVLLNPLLLIIMLICLLISEESLSPRDASL